MKICASFFYVMIKIFCVSIRFVKHVHLFPTQQTLKEHFPNCTAVMIVLRKLQYITSCREKNLVCVYFETSHWKSKSDGLGSVVKSYVSREIVANELIIRNRQDMYEFCVANFTVVEGETSHGKYHTLSGQKKIQRQYEQLFLMMIIVE